MVQGVLTHWGRATHIRVSNLTIIGSDNGLSPDRRQTIIWNNGGLLLIRTLGTNFSELFSVIHTFLFKKMQIKMWSVKRRQLLSQPQSADKAVRISRFPSKRPVMRNFVIFFYLHLNKRLSKQSRRWLFKTPSRPSWRHSDVLGRV